MNIRILTLTVLATATIGATAAIAGDARATGDCLDVACAVATLVPTGPSTIEGGSTAEPKYGTWGIDLSGRDLAVKPGDDFYRYANGTWDEHTEIPADRTRFGNFDLLSILSENRTRAIIEAAAAGKSSDPDGAKIGAAYTAFMNEAEVEARDGKPLAADLDAVRATKDRAALAALMGTAPRTFQNGIFGSFINADAKDPDRYAVYLGTGGLGLPDRDYYLEPSLAEKKAKYQAYVATMLGQVDWPDAEAAAKAVVDYETRIAEASWTRAERRDRDKTYNPMSLAELAAAAPQFAWKRFMAQAGLTGVDRFIVTTNTAVPKIAKIFDETPLPTLQAWAAFHVVDSAAPYLSQRFVDAHFAFHNHELAGQPEIQPRWKRGVAFVNRAIGESVGRLYVAQYFPPESKAKMEALVADLETALGGRIRRPHLDERGDQGQGAGEALQVRREDRLPGQVARLRQLQVTADDLYGNAERASAYQWDYRRRPPQRAGRQARVGHDAADGERLLQRRPTTRSSSPPPSCSRRSSIPTPTRRSTTAASAA